MLLWFIATLMNAALNARDPQAKGIESMTRKRPGWTR